MVLARTGTLEGLRHRSLSGLRVSACNRFTRGFKSTRQCYALMTSTLPSSLSTTVTITTGKAFLTTRRL
jgi:hypothetical protein